MTLEVNIDLGLGKGIQEYLESLDDASKHQIAVDFVVSNRDCDLATVKQLIEQS
jgi:hypothetical protein